MKNLFSIVIALLSLLSCFAQQKPNTLTKNEKQEGWELLFDGKTTNGWRNYGKETTEGWRVMNGILYNSGGGSRYVGDIITVKQYDNFELYLEWKISKNGNSGIFFHVNDATESKIYHTGPEFQLFDDKNAGVDNDPKHSSGANYAMNPPVGGKVRPLGKFNSSRLIVNDRHVEHWLNGVKVVTYELWSEQWKKDVLNCKWKDIPSYGKFKTGSIGLQDHGGLTMFRNVKIRSL